MNFSIETAYRHVLTRGSFAVDVGAHVGRHTIPMASAVGPEGEVLAFEPLPTARAKLERRLQALRAAGTELARVEVRSEALSCTEGTSAFVEVIEFPEYSGLRRRRYCCEVTTRRRRVRTCTLDSFRWRIPSVDLVKIDTEGGEFHILSGAASILKQDRPVVLFELEDDSIAGYGIRSFDLYDLLSELDYCLFTITGTALGRREFAASAAAQKLCDYVAAPREREPLIRSLTALLRAVAP